MQAALDFNSILKLGNFPKIVLTKDPYKKYDLIKFISYREKLYDISILYI
jgi:hypothetical protein